MFKMKLLVYVMNLNKFMDILFVFVIYLFLFIIDLGMEYKFLVN